MSWFDLHALRLKLSTTAVDIYVKDRSYPLLSVKSADSWHLTHWYRYLVLPRVLVVAGIFGIQQSVLVNFRVVIIPTWQAPHLLLSLDASFDLFSPVGVVLPFILCTSHPSICSLFLTGPQVQVYRIKLFGVNSNRKERNRKTSKDQWQCQGNA